MQPLSDQTLRFGEKIAAVTMGVDALYRTEIGSKNHMDGLVVVNMGWEKTEPFASYEEARARLGELARETFALAEPDRRLYYLQACLTLDSFCAYRQGLLPRLGEQVGMFLHVDPAPISDAALQQNCDALSAMLTARGFTGSLMAQCAEWEARLRVPAEEVESTMNALIREARERCGRIVELPELDYHCEVERGGAFSARSDFANLRVVVNIDPVYTYPALKHLVCHEVYPGHYIQFSQRKALHARGLAAADGLLSVVNHSSSSTFEGIADMGIEFIDWVTDDDDRICQLLGEIKSACGTVSSYQMHTLGWQQAELIDWLKAHTLVGGEGAINSRMRFIADPARAALIWSYWRGDEGVRGVWRRVAKEDRPRFYDYIYGRLHTVQSLQLFR
jgi:hypothetical protein